MTKQPTLPPTIRSVWIDQRQTDRISYIALTASGKDRRLWEHKDTPWGRVLRTYLHPKYENQLAFAEKKAAEDAKRAS